ncbi:MAG: Crp/Fnr family transcriptional regulator [Desulfobacteraceae bacterium]|nr:MAG: Crp/Fnr family transcriptional regulator [Desulfobacteraceae bacterium]
MVDEIINWMKGVPLFQDLSQEQLLGLARIAEDRTYAREEKIFADGDPGIGFFVTLTGRVKIFKISPDGKEQILHLIAPGEPFGEVPVFSGQNFPAHAEALEKSRIFFFPRSAFIELIKQDPGLALNMLALLSRRLRRFAALIDDLSLKEVPGRLAAYLLYLSDQKKGATDLALDITKSQLASLLGTIPETISRILGKMVKQGLIESDGHRIRILDSAGLEALVDTSSRL